jgi:hypothetical protein
MTDREMLLLLYGAVKAVTDEDDKLWSALCMLENHLFPEPEEEPTPSGGPIRVSEDKEFSATPQGGGL